MKKQSLFDCNKHKRHRLLSFARDASLALTEKPNTIRPSIHVYNLVDLELRGVLFTVPKCLSMSLIESLKPCTGQKPNKTQQQDPQAEHVLL